MKTKSMLWSAATLTVLLFITGISYAQEVTGSIVGTVKDSNGAGVPGATVTAIIPTQGNLVIRKVTTNEEGAFSIPNVPTNVYSLSFEAPNFKKLVQTEIKVDVGQRRLVDAVLESGRIEEIVTVEAEAVAVDLTSAMSGTVISGSQARELSINNRNFTQLVTLAPGVTHDLSDQVYVGTVNPEGQANIVSIAVNGARSSQNTFTVDGADVTDRGSNLTIQAYPSVDSIGEFKVLRSLYPAESGRSGGGQVNVVTRSGTSEFHGVFYEFVRNEKLNANTFLINGNPSSPKDENGKAIRPPFRYNNFGWTVGGPVYFLNFGDDGEGGVFKRYDRTFFFVSQEFRRDIRYPTLSSTVPDANLRQGVFPIDICLQATGTTCNTVLPAGTPLTNVAAINPISQQYLDYIWENLPLPNSTSATAPYTLTYPTRNVANFRQEVFKIDHSFSNQTSMYYRFQNDKIPTEDANSLFSSGSGLPGVSLTNTNSPGRTHTAQVTHVFSPNFILEGRYTYGYGAILSENVGLLALSNSPITPPFPYPVTRDRAPTVTGSGFSNLQSFGPYDNFSWKQNFSGTATWISGNHTMKFGAVYSMYRKNENALAGSNEGTYSAFNTPGATSVVLPAGLSGALNTSRQSWANFLLGTNATFTQASFDYTADLRQMTFEAFAQDEWRVRPNLTLYYGVRYSYFASPYDKNGRLTNFVPELWSASSAPLVTGAGNRVPGTGNYCNGLVVNAQNYITGPSNFNCTPIESPWGKYIVDAPTTDFAPRIGIAWDPFGKGETSIRTGYGIYHEQVLNGTLLQQIGLNPPYQQTCTVTGINIANPVPGGNCTVAASNTSPNIRGLQANWKTPYMQHWSLDVQQQLTSKTVLNVGYYGSKGTNIIGAFELNLLAPGYAISRGPTGCATGASTTPTAPCQVAGTAFFSSAASAILDQLRPYRGYRSVNIVMPMYDSNYHSFQAFLQHRFTGDSEVNLAYTWGRNMTNNQNDRSSAPQDSFDIVSEYGRAALDRRHVFTASYVYELPFKFTNGFAQAVLGGWQVSGIFTAQSGLPFTATTSAFDPAGVGFIPALIAGGRPNQTCDPNQGGAQTQQQWFNTSCFTPNPVSSSTTIPNVPGTAGRGVINGPSTTRLDLTVSKNFRFGEEDRYRIQLRGESFNTFNTTNFRTISTNVTAANFGQVTAVRDPRVIQLGIKFYW